MKYSVFEKIQAAGLITAEQQRQIVEHFRHKEENGKVLVIFSFVGAILAVAGIALLISANWADIPRGVKLGAGLLLMLGAHAGGWYLREVRGAYRKTGEALQFAGSCLFLGNIALVGQIYHLSARAPDAFLLWWIGIAALPWLLRSKAQHILSLLAFGLWFGLEINETDSRIYFGEQFQILLYALLGLAYLGGGYCLRRTVFAEFASATEKLGLLAFLTFVFPLTWEVLGWQRAGLQNASNWVMPAMGALALTLIAAGTPALRNLTPRWRWTWGLALVAMLALLLCQFYVRPALEPAYGPENGRFPWVWSTALFVFCLLQIQAGVQERSAFMVNLGVTFIALDIIAAYLDLFGSMARTGFMFLVSGVFLIGFGVFLEKRRRVLVRQIKAPAV